MKYKIFSLILAFIMISATFPAMAELTDIKGLECEQDVKLLEELDIVEGISAKEYAPDEFLNRAEMVAIILRIMGVNAEDYASEIIFDDVSDEFWAYREIGAAYKLGIVNGVGNNMFAPEENVTCNQAIKMLVNLLGYEKIASAAGGYPRGYLEMARRLELDERLKSWGENDITRGQMAILVVNALNARMAETSVISVDEVTLSQSEETLLKRYLDIDKVEGRVNANYYQSVSGHLAPDAGMVIIDDATYYSGKSNIEAMIGEDVIAYVKESENRAVSEVVFVSSESFDIIEINGADVEYVSGTNTIKYTSEDSKNAKISLSSADIYINGVEAINLNSVNMNNTRIKYIENPDGNIILAESYVDKTVKDVDEDREIIYFNNSSSISLDDYDRVFLTLSNGNKIGLDEIAKWNILSYYTVNRNGESVFIGVVCDDEAIEGVLKEKADSDSLEEITVDDKQYYVSATLDGTLPSLGKNIRFYVNHMGIIAYVTDNAVPYKYGYVTGIDARPFRDAVIKIFTDEGEFKILTLSEKVKINGTNTTPEALVSSSELCPGGTLKEQLIRYELKRDEEVVSITTAGDALIPTSDRAIFGRNYYTDTANKGGTARWLGTFSTKYIVDSDTVYFTVPAFDGSTEKDYKVTDVNTFVPYSSNVGDAYFYDVDDDNVIGAILQVKTKDVGDGFDFKASGIKYGVVSGKRVVIDEEKGECPVIKIITKGSNLSETQIIIDENESPIRMKVNANVGCELITNESDPYYDKEYISYKDIDIGDIMIFRVDDNGVAFDAQMLVRAKYPKCFESLAEESPSEFYSETGYYAWASSTVKNVGEHGIRGDVMIYNGGPYERTFRKEFGGHTLEVMMYNSETNEIEKISWEAIQPTDRFSICQWAIYPGIMLIYR